MLITCACIPTLGPFITYLREKDLWAAFRAITQIRGTRGHSDRIALRDYGSVGKLTDSTTKVSSVRQDDVCSRKRAESMNEAILPIREY